MISGKITDAASGVAPASAAYTVVDDQGEIQPSGPISLAPDGSYSFTLSLAADRNGNEEDGRHYTITVRAQDQAGNPGSAVTTVTVPHDP